MSLTRPPICPKHPLSHEPKLLSRSQLIFLRLQPCNMNRFTSVINSFNASRSLDRAFVLRTLRRQAETAKTLRGSSNRPRLLFSTSFSPVRTICINGIPVQEDTQGVQALLSDAAQACFTAEYYYQLVKDDLEIVTQGDNVILLPLSFPYDLLPAPNQNQN